MVWAAGFIAHGADGVIAVAQIAVMIAFIACGAVRIASAAWLLITDLTARVSVAHLARHATAIAFTRIARIAAIAGLAF